MKSIIQNLTKCGRTVVAGILMVSAATMLNSCQKEDVDLSDLSGTYFGGGSGPAEIDAPIAGTSTIEYLFYTNLDVEWVVNIDYGTTSKEWVNVWPNRGRKDGRIKVTVLKNEDYPYERTATINIVSGGKVLKSIPVKQDPVAPRLLLNMDGKTRVSYGSGSSSRAVYLDTNVDWIPEIVEPGVNWITFGDYTPLSQVISVSPNTGSAPRSATVRFSALGLTAPLSVDIEVRQRDESSDAGNATLTTISNLLAGLPGGVGEITDNVKIEGYVISDLSARNLDVMRDWDITTSKVFDWQTDYQKRFMFVQDNSGRGMMFEWEDERDNTYPLNTKITLHLIEQTVAVDDYYGAKMVKGLLPENVISSEASANGPAPVEVTSIDATNIANYENTLVKLKNVEFALPIGTYVNIDEKNYNKLHNTDALKPSSPYFDTNRQYSQILMDANDNTMKLLTTNTFIERFNRLIPKGNGDITGIVTARKTMYGDEFVLRLRKDSENEISNDESTRKLKPVVQFGLFPDSNPYAKIEASVGSGDLKTSRYESIAFSSSGGVMYWSCSYTRMEPSTITIAADDSQVVMKPIPGTSTDNYLGFYNPAINQGGWWNMPGTSITDLEGEAWIMTVNTEGVTGDLWLGFATSSSAAGPLEFTVEWADLEDAPAAQWVSFFDYECGHWDVNLHAPQYFCRVPDEVKGKSSVVIRHRVTSGALNAARNAAVGAGTNRMCYWSLGEKK